MSQFCLDVFLFCSKIQNISAKNRMKMQSTNSSSLQRLFLPPASLLALFNCCEHARVGVDVGQRPEATATPVVNDDGGYDVRSRQVNRATMWACACLRLVVLHRSVLHWSIVAQITIRALLMRASSAFVEFHALFCGIVGIAIRWHSRRTHVCLSLCASAWSFEALCEKHAGLLLFLIR